MDASSGCWQDGTVAEENRVLQVVGLLASVADGSEVGSSGQGGCETYGISAI